jgi:hypothetical protein
MAIAALLRSDMSSRVSANVLPLIVGTGALVLGAVLLATLFRLQSVVSFLLAVYLIAWTEIVIVIVTLSMGRWVTVWPLVAMFGAIAVVACLAWLTAGRPEPPPFRTAVPRALAAASDPLVALPLAASAAALSYTLVVTLTTAPNDGDPLAYELTRAAFWRQENGVVDLDASYESRLDAWPPVAEIGVLMLLLLSGTDQLAGIPQWIAVLMLALGTYGVARRIDLDRRPALWAASLVPIFPVVITQSWSAFTDVVFAAFAVAAVYFGLGSARVELLFLALASGLGVGTKLVAPILAPLFLGILALGQPVRRWPQLFAAAVSVTAVASLWFVYTQAESGNPVGQVSRSGGQSHELAPIVTTFQLLTSEVFDLSGIVGGDVWMYAGAALLVIGVGLLVRGFRRGELRYVLAAGILVAALPHLVEFSGRAFARIGFEVGKILGRPDLVDQLRDWRPSEVSDGAYSWFGPVGAVLAIGAIAIAFFEVRRARLPPVAVGLAAAPIAAIALISLAISYQNHQGRYFIAPFALCTAAVGGFALRHRWVGLALASGAIVTALLVLANSLGKPTGFGLLHGDSGRSVWAMPRWEQQGLLRSTPSERDEAFTLRFVEERIPGNASVGIALVPNSFGFPYFGRNLERRLTIVDEGDTVPEDVDWLVAAPGRSFRACRSAWRRERLGSFGWSVWRRTGADEPCGNVFEEMP